METKSVTEISEPPFSRFLFANTKMAWLWLIVRIYVGWQWLTAGWEKLGNPAWTGNQAGAAVKGFLSGALAKTSGSHPDVQGWYAYFIQHFALPHAAMIAQTVTWAEILIGVALILGLFTGLAAFAGAFLNMNYLFAGTVSINPLLLLLELFLILAWRIGGWYGVDHVLLPHLGTPWDKGPAFQNNPGLK